MRIQQLLLPGMMSLTIALAGCASNSMRSQHEAASKNVRGMCAAEFTTNSQGRRSARLIRDPEADSGFLSGRFPADIKVWVTATGVGTKLITLHATSADDVIAIPVERIIAVALQSCEVVGDQEPPQSQRVLTTSN